MTEKIHSQKEMNHGHGLSTGRKLLFSVPVIDVAVDSVVFGAHYSPDGHHTSLVIKIMSRYSKTSDSI